MSYEAFQKFGYPGALVKEYNNWMLFCAPRQATLGCFLLVCKDAVTALSKISKESFDELQIVTQQLEKTTQGLFHYDRINYLMLAMANLEVHFYIVPRYAHEQEFHGVMFRDKGWPSKPDTDFAHELNEEVFQALVSTLKTAFARSGQGGIHNS